MGFRFIASLALSWLALGCAIADIGEGEDPALDEIEFKAENGIFLDNGLKLPNGIELPNGAILSNGLDLANGIDLPNGIDLANGIKLPNGITGPYYAPPAGSGLEQWIDVDPAMRTRILRYLIECALPAGVPVQLRYRNRVETLGYGVAGLGATLKTGTMRIADQERVTACMLARMNGTGRSVQIDMFGPMGGMAGFETTVPADDAFPVLEAAFFGNLFSAQPTAQACQELPYELGAMRSCRDLGDGGYDCGILEFTSDPCTIQGDPDGYTQCDIDFTTGSSERIFYRNCAGGEVSWQYVLTTYVKLKPAGEPCLSPNECASDVCDGACQ